MRGKEMRLFMCSLGVIVAMVTPAAAVEFLGIKLCKGSVSTAVVLPEDSPLTVESVEVGSRGDLVILLASRDGDAMAHVDDLMERYTGSRGTGSSKALQWSGKKITAYGKLLTKEYVALAVSTSDTCETASEVPAEATVDQPKPEAVALPEPTDTGMVIADEPVEAAMVAAAAAAQRDEATDAAGSPGPEPVESTPDYELRGDLKHTTGPDGWVDVMGVVVNHTDQDFQLATFDLAFFDTAGDLICVDTISVSVLKAGQQRAFRDSIRCADYRSGSVAGIDLQFAGGY